MFHASNVVLVLKVIKQIKLSEVFLFDYYLRVFSGNLSIFLPVI